jgi:defect in organelle trafficking protein DotA
MKKYEKYIEWAGTLILLLIPGLCFADDVFSKMTFVPPATDVSVGYLAKIFGYVPGITQFTPAGKTILGAIFYVFNNGVLAISGLFLGYTTFKIITEMTTDGTSMAKSTTMYTIGRVGGATALLVPDPTSGYSMINTFVMWIVLQSIGLADQTWNAALDYLKSGVPTTAVATNSTIDYSLVNPLMYSGNATIDSKIDGNSIGSADVLRSLVCSYSVKIALSNAIRAAVNGPAPNVTEFSTYQHVPAVPPTGDASSYTDGYYQFPYIASGTDATTYTKYGVDSNTAANIANLPINGVCGTISYVTPKPSSDTEDEYGNFSQIYVPAKQAGLQAMITTLDPIAQQLVAQAQPDENGKVQLQPGNYVVLQGSADGTVQPTYFTNVTSDDYSSPSLYAGKLSYTNFYTQCKDETSCPESGKALTADSSATEINWPLGAADMLAAAVTYQAGVAAAATAASPDITAAMNQSVADAKGKGWLLAGSYYTLLEQAIQTSLINYDYYKLSVSTDTVNAKSNRLTFPTYDPFFTTSGSIANVFTTLDSSGSSFDVLKRTLAWIYFSAPYAKILGTTYASAADTEINLNVSPARNYLVWTTTDLIAIDFQLAAGCVLLAIPPAALCFLPFPGNLLCFSNVAVGIVMLTGVPMEYLWADVNQVMGVWNSVMNGNAPTGQPITDPIVKLQLLGQQMIQSSLLYLTQIQGFFIGTSLAFIINSAIMSAVTAVLGLGSFWGITEGVTVASQAMMQVTNQVNEIVKTIIAMYLPIGLAAVSPLLLTGITLAVYVPLIPYLLFLFGVMSWVISVIVLMAAAPIICFLMIWGAASQDNPLLSRESEDFIRQLLSVFFKPVLMIMGLVVGVVLARIGVAVLNAGFQTILDSVFPSTGLTSTTNSNLIMIESIGAVVIYTFTMVSLVNLCFSAIHLLHNEVMTVVGMRVIAGAGIEEKAMGEVKAGGQQFAEAGASGAKESAQSLKGLQNAGKVENYQPAVKKDKKPKGDTTAT